MRKITIILAVALPAFLFTSCKDETEQLLTKKWDCVKVENLDLSNGGFQSRQDSLNSAQVIAALETLNWTFKEDHEYECAVGSRVMVKGTYGLMEDGKTIICTPDTKNNINRYNISTLTENDLVLRSANPPLVLHFRAH